MLAQKSVVYKNQKFEINYEIANPKLTSTIVILHGWGSNKEVMKQAFGWCLEKFKHIYIDMPGFGKSPCEVPLKTDDYANILKIFLNGENMVACIGHSFGGKVATLLNPPTLILLSSSGILEPKPLKVRAKIKLFKILKPFGGALFFKLFASKDVNTMSTVMYQTFKNVVDEDFSARFTDFKNKALIFWGISDTATSLSSGETISKLIQNSQFYPLQGDHYFFLKQKNVVCDIIAKNLEG